VQNFDPSLLAKLPLLPKAVWNVVDSDDSTAALSIQTYQNKMVFDKIKDAASINT